MKKKLIDEIEIKKLVIKELIKELSILKCQMHLDSDKEKEEGLSKEEWNRFMYLEGKRTFNTKINEERSFGEKVRDIRLIAFFTKKDQMQWLNIKDIHIIDEIENAITASELNLETLIKLYIGFDEIKNDLYGIDKYVYVWGVSINEIVDELTQAIHIKIKGKEKVLRKEYSDSYDRKRIL